MTCVVGLVDGDTVYIGGDSLGCDAATDQVVGRADEKVFITDAEDFIFGFSGSFRVGQLLRYALVTPGHVVGKDDMAYMVTDFIDAWRALMKDKGAMKKQDVDEEYHECNVLVGYRGRLYAIEEDFDVGRPRDDYYAIGSGAKLAYGSLHSTAGLVRDPRKRITMALDAASAYCAAVRPPYTIMSLKRRGA